MAAFNSILRCSVAGLGKSEARLHMAEVEHHVQKPQQQRCNTGTSRNLCQGASDHLERTDLFHRR